MFADPVADIAVLGEPDNRALSRQYESYVRLTDPVVPFTIGPLEFIQQPRRLPSGQVIHGPWRAKAQGQMLSLDLRWFGCHVTSLGRFASVEKPESPIAGGMSGSPILGLDGTAIAVVSVWDQQDEDGPNPLLADVLPGCLLKAGLAGSAN